MKRTRGFTRRCDRDKAACPIDFSIRPSRRIESFRRFTSVAVCLISLGIALLLSAGPGWSQAVNPTSSNPQLVVKPETVRLGLSRVLDTVLMFEGTGFGPAENVMLLLTDSKPTEPATLIPLAFGETDEQGRFAIEMDKTMKIYNLLNAEVTIRKKGAVLLVSLPPVPTGNYRVEATGYESGRIAYHRLILAPPSLWDRLKDRIARLIGKIERE